MSLATPYQSPAEVNPPAASRVTERDASWSGSLGAPSLAQQLWGRQPPATTAAFRWLVFAVLGALVGSGIAVFAYSLIARQQAVVLDDAPSRPLRFIRVDRGTRVERRSRELPKKLSAQPREPQMPTVSLNSNERRSVSPQDLRIEVPTTSVSMAALRGGGVGLIGAGVSSHQTLTRDGDYLPLVRAKPLYPIEAHERGVEGWVDVAFTVLASGRVADPRVLGADPPGVFNRAALDAVKHWRYRPTVKNGVAVAARGVRARVSFRINDP